MVRGWLRSRVGRFDKSASSLVEDHPSGGEERAGLPMTTVAVSELESAIENWRESTAAASKGRWNRYAGFWLVSEPRQVHFRLCFDGLVEIELLEGGA
jgi:hypothetical protein